MIDLPIWLWFVLAVIAPEAIFGALTLAVLLGFVVWLGWATVVEWLSRARP